MMVLNSDVCTAPTFLWRTCCHLGKHEFGESWFLNVAPGERGIDLSLLLAIVAAASAAIAVDGRVLDESSLVGGGNIGGGELLVRASSGPERSATDALTALGSPIWGE